MTNKMRQRCLSVVLAVFLCTSAFCKNTKFPADFLFGVATSAYQVEGGYDSRGETTWDYNVRLNPKFVIDGSNATIACDSYNRLQDDINLISDLGVDFYRFSISWARILPKGYPYKLNPAGLDYYNKLINSLLTRNIQPMVTMYHYDMPKPLQDIGGFTNPLLSDLFLDYARILFKNFGDRVKYWVTFNAGWGGYGDDFFAPALNQSGIAEYLFVKNVLLAHSKVYHLYKDNFRKDQNGEIGFTIDGHWFEPGTQAPEDVEAAERVRDFRTGLFAHPLLLTGDFPQRVKERVDRISAQEGFPRSRLPVFSPEEQKYIKGAYDFLGLNIYTTFLVKNAPESTNPEPSLAKDTKATIYQDPTWPKTPFNILRVVPWGLRKILSWVKSTYNNPKIIVTENGCADIEDFEDTNRIEFYNKYLSALLDSIHEDGVRVKGYTAWTLLDNFEWMYGYSLKFGLYHVNFTDPNRKRTPKASATWYKKFLEHRDLEESPKSEL